MTRIVLPILATLGLACCGPAPIDPASAAADKAVQMLYSNRGTELLDVLTPASRTAILKALNLEEGASNAVVAGKISAQLGWKFESFANGRTRVVEGAGDVSLRIVEMGFGEFGARKLRVPVERIGHEWRVDLVNAKAVHPTRKGTR